MLFSRTIQRDLILFFIFYIVFHYKTVLITLLFTKKNQQARKIGEGKIQGFFFLL